MAWIDRGIAILYLVSMPGGDLPSTKSPAFVSHQVTEAQRYFLDLQPKRSLPMVVVCGGCERLRADYVVERSTFPFWCIEFVAEGAGTLQLKGKCYPLRAGMAFAYAPGIPHVIQNDPGQPMRKYYVDFAGKEAVRLLRATRLGSWEPVQLASPHETLEIFNALQRDATAEPGLREPLCAAHLKVLLLKIGQKGLRLQKAEPRAMATFERARRYLEQHFARLRSAEEIAEACHMTPVHLSRVYQRFAHITPYHALLRLKMNRATELLLDRRMLVKEVAEHLQFSSQFQFSRAFKRTFGVAPDHFLRQSPRSAPAGTLGTSVPVRSRRRAP